MEFTSCWCFIAGMLFGIAQCQNFVTDHLFGFVLEQQTVVICWKVLRLCLAVSKMSCACVHALHEPCKNCASEYEALQLIAH